MFIKLEFIRKLAEGRQQSFPHCNEMGSSGFGYSRKKYYKHTNPNIKRSTNSLVCWCIGSASLVFLFGILIGRYSVSLDKSNGWKLAKIHSSVLNDIDKKNIRDNLRKLTIRPHSAGSENDEEVLVKFVEKTWKGYLDHVEVYPYQVLLSLPNMSDPNYIALVDDKGSLRFKSNWTEKPVTADEAQPGVLPAFNAYGAQGHVEGHLFYVNYGRYEDYEMLASLAVNVTGGVCIARYGYLFRGSKAKEAEKHGCIALIIYSDPVDYGGVGKHSWDPAKGDKGAYPNTWWLPSTGFQRGTLILEGDPLTPGYPAVKIAYRIPESQAALPTIPVQPISYGDAYHYISLLDGIPAPDLWQGGFSVVYRTGGSFRGPYAKFKTQVHVSNYKQIKTVHTVIGYLYGWQEPDRFVLVGNHRDAWTFGGDDPNSGTAVVLEVSRALAKQVTDSKWRPRRTVVFCNWAAEEFGTIGSTEWVEQMEKRLLFRAVAYINIDKAVGGNDTFDAYATPELVSLIYNSTKSVDNPLTQELEQGRLTVYETWLAKNRDPFDPDRPKVKNLGSGSDFIAFLQKTGVSAADISYTTQRSAVAYPAYHSIHDTFDYFERFQDSDFNISQSVGKVAARLLLKISDSTILPFHPLGYARKLHQMVQQLQVTYGSVLKRNDIILQNLTDAISEFNASAKALNDIIKKFVHVADPLALRQLNDKLQYINRGFLDFSGVFGEHQYRHVIFAPSSHNSYNGSGFPGIVDSIFAAERGGSWNEVRQQISIASLNVLSAAELMVT